VRIAVVVEHGWEAGSVEVDPLSGAVDERRAVASLSEASRAAVALALGLCDQHGGTVAVLAAAPATADIALRSLLAAGAGEVGRVWAGWMAEAGRDSAARALAAPVAALGAALLLTGDRSLDGGRSPLGPMLAELLGLPEATAVEHLELDAARGEVRVRRRLPGGARERLAVALPAVVCVEPGIADLRDAALPALIAAQADPVPVVEPARVGAPGARRVRRLPPRPRPRRLPAPDPALPVAARLDAVLGSGRRRDHDHVLVEGAADLGVERILELLEQRGHLPAPFSRPSG
jgi:electron transfer flavoprotein beta subunit